MTTDRNTSTGSGCRGDITTTSIENPFPVTTADPNSLGERMRGAVILQSDGGEHIVAQTPKKTKT